MQHLEEADIFEEVEGIISASDFIKNRRGPTALHLDPLDPPVAGWKPRGVKPPQGRPKSLPNTPPPSRGALG
jgi:hypothetical protein